MSTHPPDRIDYTWPIVDPTRPEEIDGPESAHDPDSSWVTITDQTNQEAMTGE